MTNTALYNNINTVLDNLFVSMDAPVAMITVNEDAEADRAEAEAKAEAMDTIMYHISDDDYDELIATNINDRETIEDILYAYDVKYEYWVEWVKGLNK